MSPGVRAEFSSGSDGDLRHDLDARSRYGTRVGASTPWATVHQVHGPRVVTVASTGEHGDADGLVTDRVDVPLAVFTADCLGIVIDAGGVVAVAHAGWRGLDAGVIEAALHGCAEMGGQPEAAWIGPSIGPCCFEVGEEVAERFPDHVRQTTWGTTSVDLREAATARLGVATTVDARCTRCTSDLHSHREDATSSRLAAVGWLTS